MQREKPTEPSLIDANWSIEDKTGHFWRLIDCKCMYVVQCVCVSQPVRGVQAEPRLRGWRALIAWVVCAPCGRGLIAWAESSN